MQNRKRVCRVCYQGLELSYKKPEVLRQFINRRGRIFARRNTHFCAKHQRRLALEINRARKVAILPYEETT